MTKRILNGKVIKDKNNKTIVVLVKRKYIHPFFKKLLLHQKNIMLMMKKINLK